MKRRKASRLLPVTNAPQHVVELLNDREHQKLDVGTEVQEELKKFVDLWLASGPNLLKMGQAMGSVNLKRLPTSGRFHLQLTGDGRPLVITSPEPGSTDAQGIFLQLILHPLCEQLAGPCSRCGNYFLKKKRNHKIYCSPKCRVATTAVSSTKKARDKHRAEKLARIREAINAWRHSRSEEHWQRFTVRWVNQKYGAIITRKLLTRWVNLGTLQLPRKLNESH